jgi:hypothetical protein
VVRRALFYVFQYNKQHIIGLESLTVKPVDDDGGMLLVDVSCKASSKSRVVTLLMLHWCCRVAQRLAGDQPAEVVCGVCRNRHGKG